MKTKERFIKVIEYPDEGGLIHMFGMLLIVLTLIYVSWIIPYSAKILFTTFLFLCWLYFFIKKIIERKIYWVKLK